MKKYIFAAFIALAFAPVASAQDWSINGQIKDPKYHTPLEFPHDNGVKIDKDKNFGYSKNISSPFSDGTYWIKLESFATGAGKVVDKPSDIVLVLDVSGSMRNNYGNGANDWYAFGCPSGYASGYNYSHLQPNAAMSGNYYKVGDNYYPVRSWRFDRGQGSNPRYDYYAGYEIDGVRHYLYGTGEVSTRPTNVHGQSDPLYWGPLWKQKHKSRMNELQDAVKDFVDLIQENDLYFTDPDTGEKIRRTDADGNPTSLGNKISIIKFAHSAWYNSNHLLVGNHTGAAGTNSYNYTELAIDLTNVDTEEGKNALYAAVDGLVEGGHTAADYGTQLANEVLATITRESNRTVVLFTDGDPNHNDGFVTSVANSTIANANVAKTTYNATVFAVAVFDSENDNRRNYMNRVSSNYTGATSMTTGTQITPASKRIYYQNAADGNLRQVFANIAKQAGGSSSALSAATSNVDVVSNSFILPAGTNADNIASVVKVFTAPLTRIDASGNYVFGTETLAGHATDTYDVLDEDGEVIGTYKVDEVPNPNGTTPATLPIKVELEGTNGIKVTNFDYGNNWCGTIENQAHQVTGYHGHKIIIMIPIQMNPDAVGGPNVETNDEGSGIFSGGEPYVEFVSPTVSLPVNIYVEKAGLEGVESARFKIEKAVLPDLPEGVKEYTLEMIQGIPEANWSYVTTVFVTNSTNAQHAEESGNPMVRVKGLPADEEVEGGRKGLVYRVSEESWSWSYNATGEKYQYTVTGQVNNPFTFTNSKKTGIDQTVKHAESKVTNVFKSGVTNEVYDDSKQNTR